MPYPICPNTGNYNAPYMIVGEAPGANEIEQQTPFIGASGTLLRSSLLQCGLDPAAFFITNVCKHRPPGNNIEAFMVRSKTPIGRPYKVGASKLYPNDILLADMQELESEVARIKPKAIIALGNLPLWFFTGETGITTWRGSELHTTIAGHTCPLMPTLHPAYVLRVMEEHQLLLRDLYRFRDNIAQWGEPEFEFIIPETYTQAVDALRYLEKFPRLTCDIETKLRTQVLCVGFGTSPLNAVIIPFVSNERPLGYYTLGEEIDLIQRINALLTNSATCIGNQNFSYDRQFLARMWGVLPRMDFDTMIAQSVLFPGTKRDLAYLSSMYCDHHTYWKDDLKDWREETTPDKTLFTYNGKDCARTFEIALHQEAELSRLGLTQQYAFQIALANTVIEMMLRGVAKATTQADVLKAEIREAIACRETWLREVAPSLPDRWWASSTQLKHLCYDVFGVKPVLDKKTKKPTTGREAIPLIAKREPILRPLLDTVVETRALENSQNVITLQTDPLTGRWYTNFTVAGAKTFRFTSSENPFGYGSNLQNISSGKEVTTGLKTPNLRRMFAPDPGYIMFDADLERADAQFVAWDSGDEALKDLFKRARTDHTLDLHMENARTVFGAKAEKRHRQMAKQAVHAVNYAVGPKTLATTLGIPILEAQRFMDTWFTAHPSIKTWHERTLNQLMSTRTIYNVFGYRIVFLGRLEGMLSEALGWQGQSGTALVCANAMLRLRTLPYVTMLLQVHDSIVFQVPIDCYPQCLPEIKAALENEAPYPDDPLLIPWSAKASTRNWGSCVPVSWDDPPPIDKLA